MRSAVVDAGEHTRTLFALLDATLGLDSDGSLGAAGAAAGGATAPRRRCAVRRRADRGWRLRRRRRGLAAVDRYAGDAAAKTRALRCRTVDTLTEAGETLGSAQVLVAVKPPDLARLGGYAKRRAGWKTPPKPMRWPRCRPTRCATGAPPASGSKPCGWPKGQVRSDLDWLVELEAVTGRDPPAARRPTRAADGRRA